MRVVKVNKELAKLKAYIEYLELDDSCIEMPQYLKTIHNNIHYEVNEHGCKIYDTELIPA